MNINRLSKRLHYGVIAIIAIVFGAFYLIGFNLPFLEDPTFNAPLMTDAVIWLTVLLLVVLLCLVAWSYLKFRAACFFCFWFDVRYKSKQ